jgi:hypothetical protein
MRLIPESLWNETNKIEFPIHEDYDPERNKIPKEVMNYLEETKRVWSPIPIGYLIANKEYRFIKDDFTEEVCSFLMQQQRTLFAYPSENIMMKANYLKLFVRNKLGNKEDEIWTQSAEAFPRYVYRDSINNNNSNARNIYQESDVSKCTRKLCDWVEKQSEKRFYKRKTSPERILREKLKNYSNKTAYNTCLKNVSQSRDVLTANPLLQIISIVEGNDGEVNTTISMPCNSEIGDELGNKWKLVGPYEEVCSENRTFNKVVERLSNKELWCNQDSSAKKKYSQSVQCNVPVFCPGSCCLKDETLRWSYECTTTLITMQQCKWEKMTGTQLYLNDNPTDIYIEPNVVVGPNI